MKRHSLFVVGALVVSLSSVPAWADSPKKEAVEESVVAPSVYMDSFVRQPPSATPAVPPAPSYASATVHESRPVSKQICLSVGKSGVILIKPDDQDKIENTLEKEGRVLIACDKLTLVMTGPNKTRLKCENVVFVTPSQIHGKAELLEYDSANEVLRLTGAQVQIQAGKQRTSNVELKAKRVTINVKTLEMRAEGLGETSGYEPAGVPAQTVPPPVPAGTFCY